MAANLTPQYYKAEEQYRTARSIPERIAALENILRVIPKHKGTDRLQGDLKSKLKEARAELQQATNQKKSGRSYRFPRQGCATVVIVGAPNSGKSRLLNEMTDAQPVVADYPFSTLEPLPGMMSTCDVQIQMIDTPPIAENFIQPYVIDLVRTADLVLCCLNCASETAIEETCEVLKQFTERKTILACESGFAPDDFSIVKVKTRLVLTHSISASTTLDELLLKNIPTISVELANSDDLNRAKTEIFESLGLIRIHTKRPGTDVQLRDPFTIADGSTVEDLAEKVHHEIASRLKFAKVWGKSAFDGQAVGRDHVLSDGDIVELH